MPADDLRALIAKFNWAQGIRATGTLAAISANSPDAKRRWSSDALQGELTGLGPASDAVADFLRRNPSRPIAHDEGLLVLQSLFALHGAEGPGLQPTPARISHLLLALNDHIGIWTRDEGLSRQERALASTARATRFDRCEDLVREIARAEGLFGRAPFAGPLSGDGVWSSFTEGALRSTVAEFVDRRLLPLALLSLMWGLESDPSWYFPLIREESWWQTSGAGDSFKTFAEDVAWTREELKAVLGTTNNTQLPVGTGHFFRKPFVAMPEGDLVAVSPGAVRWTLRAAIWSRCLERAKSTVKGGAEAWFSAFGYLAEDWCRDAARLAKTEGLSDELILSDNPGSHDEIADIVLAAGDRVVLVSVKSRMMRADVIRSAESSKAIVDWYERFFFDQKRDGHRAESFWQLQQTIERVRSGEFISRGLKRDSRIYPLLVSYDDIGDHPGLYPWLRDRCRHHGVFQAHHVAPPVVCNIADFELLLAAGVKKHGAVSLLHRKTRPELQDVPLQVALRHLTRHGLPRLRGLEARYEEITERAQQRLFGRVLRTEGEIS